MRAEEIMNENLDAVKKMNTIIATAKVDRIRQKQKQEKLEIYEDNKHYEMTMDRMMEVERLKKIQSEYTKAT